MNQISKPGIDSQIPNYRVCVLGVGFVGLTLSMSLTNSDIPVVGIELNSDQVEKYKSGSSGMIEPGLDDSLKSALDENLFKILSTDEKLDELSDCNVFIITVGTPLKNGKVNLEPIIAALGEIVKYLNDGDLIVIRSTVSIGTCRKIVKPLLDESNKRFLLAMCPERTIEGRALAEMKSLPQIIGGVDTASIQAAKEFFSLICDDAVLVDSLEAAELTKLVNNTYRDLLFGFANEIALVANEYGVSATQVIEAANYNYARSNIALPGPSGGPCLEKDPWILAESGERVGVDLRISKASRITNETFVTHYLRSTIRRSTSSLKIAILGLAFKGNPPSTDTRGSLTPTILKEVSDLIPNAKIYGYEPAGEVNSFKEFLSESNAIESVLLRADVIIIANNSESFRTVDLDIKKYSNEDAVIIDFWGYSKKSSLGAKQTLFSWAGE